MTLPLLLAHFVWQPPPLWGASPVARQSRFHGDCWISDYPTNAIPTP